MNIKTSLIVVAAFLLGGAAGYGVSRVSAKAPSVVEIEVPVTDDAALIAAQNWAQELQAELAKCRAEKAKNEKGGSIR